MGQKEITIFDSYILCNRHMSKGGKCNNCQKNCINKWFDGVKTVKSVAMYIQKLDMLNLNIGWKSSEISLIL